MLTVLVTNAKGGCGKTTIATNLAGAFANAGFATALADCDRQRSALAWAERRPSAVPAVTPLDWVQRIDTVPNEIGRLVVDAPAGLRAKDAQDLIRAADTILVPSLPSAFDHAATRRFLGQLDKLKPIRKNRRFLALVVFLAGFSLMPVAAMVYFYSRYRYYAWQPEDFVYLWGLGIVWPMAFCASVAWWARHAFRNLILAATASLAMTALIGYIGAGGEALLSAFPQSFRTVSVCLSPFWFLRTAPAYYHIPWASAFPTSNGTVICP
jgi:hypothetical protein